LKRLFSVVSPAPLARMTTIAFLPTDLKQYISESTVRINSASVQPDQQQANADCHRVGRVG
jgi:hypothetical protein